MSRYYAQYFCVKLAVKYGTIICIVCLLVTGAKDANAKSLLSIQWILLQEGAAPSKMDMEKCRRHVG